MVPGNFTEDIIMDRAIFLGFILLVTAIVLFQTGCGHDDRTMISEFRGETRTLTYGDERADHAQVAWTARGAGIRLSLEARMRTIDLRNQRLWVVTGRTDVPLIAFEAYLRPHYFLKARLVNPRQFEITFNRDEIIEIATGEPLLMRLDTGEGDIVHNAMARFKPGFANFGGTHRVFVYRWINAIAVNADDIVFRGRVKTSRGFELEQIFTDDDAGPHAIVDEHFRKWHFDFTPAELALAADRPEDPVFFQIVDTAETRYRKKASIVFRLVQLGVTLDEPDDTWPEGGCQLETENCLGELDPDSPDTEACGYADQVHRCLSPQP